jgi:hypothetical protein
MVNVRVDMVRFEKGAMKKAASRNGTNLSDGFECLSGLDQSRRNDRSVALSIGVSEGNRRAWLR